MACKWILCVLFFISFSIVSESAAISKVPKKPIYMLASFEEQLENCTLPKTIITSENISLAVILFNVTSDSCKEIHSESDRRDPKYILCRDVLTTFSSILLCESKQVTSESDSEILMVPYPEDENVCPSDQKDQELAVSDECFVMPRDCVTMCEKESALCRLLFWVCQVKNALQGKAETEDRRHDKKFSVTAMKSTVANNGKLKTANKNIEVSSHSSTLHTKEASHDQPNKHDESGSTYSKTNTNASPTTKVTAVSLTNTTVATKTVSKTVTQLVTAKTEVRDSSTSQTAVHEEDVKDKNLHITKVSVVVTQASTTTLRTDGDGDYNSIKSAVIDKMETSMDNKDVNLASDDEMQDYNGMPSSIKATESKSYDKSKTVSSITFYRTDGNSVSSHPGHAINPDDSFDKEMAGDYIQSDDSHFFLFFICVVALVIGCYVLFHNKQKIIALIIEGRHERRRRPNGASYKKLETKQ